MEDFERERGRGEALVLGSFLSTYGVCGYIVVGCLGLIFRVRSEELID